MTLRQRLRRALPWLLLATALALPWIAGALDQSFYISVVRRILIFAIAAASLNFILGYGGMVSLGHAAFFGAGAYTVGALATEGIASAWVAWPLAVAVAALAAVAIGAISLRTRGVYFIMITLAFAQMVYYVAVGLKRYGGEDGLNLPARSGVGFGIDLGNDVTFYYVVLALLVAVLVAFDRILDARFGRALIGIRENEARMESLGYPTFRFRLAAFAIAGAVAGLLEVDENVGQARDERPVVELFPAPHAANDTPAVERIAQREQVTLELVEDALRVARAHTP